MLALSLAILGGLDTDPRGLALAPAPIAHVAAAPSLRFDTGVLRVDAAAAIASDFGAALYDIDGALDAGAQLGDEDLSLALTGSLALEHARGPFVVVDGVALPADASGTFAPRASVAARFHLDMDDLEAALAWTGALASAHDARAFDVTRVTRAGDVVAAHVSQRVDADLRLALDLEGSSALVVAGAAHHAFAEPATFGWAGLGFAWASDVVDARAWAGPAFDGALDLTGALDLGFDLEDRTVIARLERRPFASPFHTRARVNGGALALSTTLAFLDVGASASGALVDVDEGDDGLRGEALGEVRWALALVTLLARATAEVCVFGPVGLARGALLVGVEL